MKLHLSRNYRRAASAAVNLPAATAPGFPSDVVISQVFGGGGSAGAPLASDFIEILNRGATAVDVGGWSIQYASAIGINWQVAPLEGSIVPGHYLLVGQVGMPTVDVTTRIVLAANAGKLALVKNTTAIVGYCPVGPDVADFVGYGSVNCAEGRTAVPELSPATAARRREAGCVDTGNNAADFEVAAPSPRNQETQPVACAR